MNIKETFEEMKKYYKIQEINTGNLKANAILFHPINFTTPLIKFIVHETNNKLQSINKRLKISYENISVTYINNTTLGTTYIKFDVVDKNLKENNLKIVSDTVNSVIKTIYSSVK